MESSVGKGEQSKNYDEMSMHQTIFLADTLKDLKKLKTQLYSAAEYFELSYINEDQKHIVVETLKDYAMKAVINTVDHIGCVTQEVTQILHEKLEQVSDAEIRVSCLQQRVRTCNEYNEREGVGEQASMIDAPRFHKHYILPGGEAIKKGGSMKQDGCNLEEQDEWNELKSAVRATVGQTTPFRKGARCVSLVSPATSRLVGSFSFSGSNTPNNIHLADSSRSCSVSPLFDSTTPKPSKTRQQQQQQPAGKSASMRLHHTNIKELQRYPSKTKRLLMSLLTRRNSNKHQMLYTFLDEY